MAKKKKEVASPKVKENIVDVDSADILEENFLNYSLSIISGRSIPDIRDGLKPVQRRILHIMNDMRSIQFTKVARISGAVSGRVHPHGTASIDDAIIRMNQPFSLNHTLLDGQGNFGSEEGDGAAAARYIETKLAKITREAILEEMKENAVDFIENYDGNELEPKLLPVKFNNTLVNGAAGIASGFSTDIPPHNLIEVCNATIAYINDPKGFNPLDYISGPDLPGGCILDTKNIAEIYKTGNGTITTRPKIEVDDDGILILEMPHNLTVEKIIDSIKDNEKLPFISSIRNEGGKGKIRIRIFLKRGTDPNYALNMIYRFSAIESTIRVNLVAVKGNNLVIAGLSTFIKEFVDFRFITKNRVLSYRLEKFEQEAHILDGLIIALDIIDELIEIIRGSKDRADAKKNILDTWEFSEIQVDKILDLRLSKLTSLEITELEEKFDAIEVEIKAIKKILSSDKNIYAEIVKEQKHIIETYGTPRKTRMRAITNLADQPEAIIQNDSFLIMLTNEGFVKKIPAEAYNDISQKHGGKGRNVGKLKQGDVVIDVKSVENHDYILAFTNTGMIHKLRVWDIKESTKDAYGFHIKNYLTKLSASESIVSVVFVNKKDYEFGKNCFIFATKNGLAKAVELSEFTNIPKEGGMIATRVKDDDELIAVRFYDYRNNGDDAYILLTTDKARTLKIPKSEIKSVLRPTYGYRAIKFIQDDKELIDLHVVPKDFNGFFAIADTDGKGKKTHIDAYSDKKIRNAGILSMTLGPAPICSISMVPEGGELVFVSERKFMKINETSFREHVGRRTKGLKLIDLEKGDKLRYMGNVV